MSIWKSMNCSVCTAWWMRQTTLEAFKLSEKIVEYIQKEIFEPYKAPNSRVFWPYTDINTLWAHSNEPIICRDGPKTRWRFQSMY